VFCKRSPRVARPLRWRVIQWAQGKKGTADTFPGQRPNYYEEANKEGGGQCAKDGIRDLHGEPKRLYQADLGQGTGRGEGELEAGAI